MSGTNPLERRLLLNEAPRVFQPTLAREFGLLAATLIQQLQFMLPRFGKEQDGTYWLPVTYEELHESIGKCESISSVKRAVAKLERAGLVQHRIDLNSNPWERTKWYTLAYEVIDARYHQDPEQPRQQTKMDDGQVRQDVKSDDGQPCGFEAIAPLTPQSNLDEPENTPKTPDPEQPRQDVKSDDGQLCHDVKSDFVLKEVLEREKEKTQSYSSTEIPREATPPKDEDKNVCVNFKNNHEKNEPIQEPPITSIIPDRCAIRDPFKACDHEVEALAFIRELEGEGFVDDRHPKLHAFLHAHPVEDFRLLYLWHMEHSEPYWRQLGNVFGANMNRCLKLALDEQAGVASHGAGKISDPTPAYFRLFDNNDHPDLGEADYVPGCPDHSRFLHGIWDNDKLSFTGCQLCHWQPEMATNPWKENQIE